MSSNYNYELTTNERNALDFVPHLIYMFEFVVDDLLITRKNYCAPAEYPTCVEITFRGCCYVNICDRDYGSCVAPGEPKCGKCVIFALEYPISNEDRIMIHVYKKKSNRCKFLIGLGEVVVKPLFDKVNKIFTHENVDWKARWQDQLKDMPKMKQPNTEVLDKCECYTAGFERREQLCPASGNSKQLLPIFNLCNQQTGNIILIMRLVCHGPTIVSSFSRPGCKHASLPISKRLPSNPCFMPYCIQPDPCYVPPPPEQKCTRFFACNRDKLCPCNYCEDDIDRACPTLPSKTQCKKVAKKCADSTRLPSFASWLKMKGLCK